MNAPIGRKALSHKDFGGMEAFSKDLFFTWQKNETTCGDDGMLFRIGKRKGRPAPPKGTPLSAGCIVQLPTPPHTRKPATLFRPAEKPFQSGRSYPQSTRLYRTERAHQQAKRLLTTTSGRHLEDTALLPPPKNRIPPQRERLWNNFRHQAAFPLDEWHP